jgi:hypothetical protein
MLDTRFWMLDGLGVLSAVGGELVHRRGEFADL